MSPDPLPLQHVSNLQLTGPSEMSSKGSMVLDLQGTISTFQDQQVRNCYQS